MLGAYAGATCVYREFIKDCTNEFGKMFSTLPPEKTGVGSSFHRDFEERMRGFCGNDDSWSLKIPLPAMKKAYDESNIRSVRYDTDEVSVIVRNEDMKGYFRTVRNGMVGMVDSQIDDVHKRQAEENGNMPLEASVHTELEIFR